MSFSSNIKEELSKINNWKDKETLKGEFLGYILTGNTSNENDLLEFITENEFNIERFYKILFNLEVEYEPIKKGKRNFHQVPILIPQQMVAEKGEDLGHSIEI